METILNQLGELLLTAVPTIILFWVIFFSYLMLVHRPLERILAERHARTAGAVEKARADVAAAEARTAEYELKLREARASIFKLLEARRKQAGEARAAAVAEARAAAQRQLAAAKAQMEMDTAAARRTLQSEGERLASEVIAAVLKPASAVGGRR